MGEGGADTAAIEVDDVALLAAREDHATAESVAALRVDQTGVEQPVEPVAVGHEVMTQVAARCIADA